FPSNRRDLPPSLALTPALGVPNPKPPGPPRGRLGRAGTRARPDGAAGVGVPPGTGEAGGPVPRGPGRGEGAGSWDCSRDTGRGHRVPTPRSTERPRIAERIGEPVA